MEQASGGPDLGRGGVIVIDKPAGPTSHDVVAAVRRHSGGVKIGHTGTLDPFATGVLPLVVGKATRLARYVGGGDKEYRAIVRLGRATDTLDASGRVVSEAPAGTRTPDAAEVARALPAFLGSWPQTPPAFSAKLTGGVRAYEQARRGVPVSLAPVPVTVSELELVGMEGPLVTLRLVVSSGFYVRAFADELGSKLGVGGCLEALRRTRSGPFRAEDAVSLDQVIASGVARALLPPEALLLDWPAVVLTEEGLGRVAHGRGVGPAEYRPIPGGRPGALVRLLGPDLRLAAIGEPAGGGTLHPAVVLG